MSATAVAPSTSPTTTILAATLLALAERFRADAARQVQADNHDKKAKADRELAEMRAAAVDILAASDAVIASGAQMATQELQLLAMIAEQAHSADGFSGDPKWCVSRWMDDEGPQYSPIPRAIHGHNARWIANRRKRAEKIAARFIGCELTHASEIDMSLLSEDMVAKVQQRIADLDASRKAKEAADAEAKARIEADHITLAKHFFDADVAAAIQSGEVDKSGVRQEIRKRLLDAIGKDMPQIPDDWLDEDHPADYEQIERISIAGYRRRKEVVAALNKAAVELALANGGLEARVDVIRHDKWTSSDVDEGEDKLTYRTVDLCVRFGAVVIGFNNVILY